MATTTAETETVHEAGAKIGGRLTEAYQKAAQFSRDACGLPGLAREAMDSGKDAVHEAANTVRRRVREFEHVPDDVAYQVRRAPFWAMGGALGAGFVVGAVVGWFAFRSTRHD